MVEAEAYTFNGRDYIVFPRPMEAAAEDRAGKDNLVISVAIKSLAHGKPNFLLGRVLVDMGSSIDLIYFKTLQKMGLIESDLMPSHDDL